MIVMRVEKQEKLFDAIEPQQHLRITIGNEAQNGPVARTSATHVGNHTQGGRSVGTHAVDHLVCQIRWEYVCLKQLRVRTMGPLLRTRAFLCEGIAKGERGAGERSDVRRGQVVTNVLSHGGNDRVLKNFASVQPLLCHSLRSARRFCSSNMGPDACNVF